MYDPTEQEDIIAVFSEMLRVVTADGGRKRAAGSKVHWTVDPGHKPALFRHLQRWEKHELVDADSGTHPLVHAAFRALALAYQEQAAADVEALVSQEIAAYRELAQDPER